MAILMEIETSYGEKRECYIRLNNVEACNHGNHSNALFRGFVSKEAFEAGKSFVWEKEVEFHPDVSQPLWPQAYAALRQLEGFETAVEA